MSGAISQVKGTCPNCKEVTFFTFFGNKRSGICENCGFEANKNII